VVVPFKKVGRPAAGIEMSTISPSATAIAAPVGVIHVQLIEGMWTRPEDGQR
jgi:hypothetical protein